MRSSRQNTYQVAMPQVQVMLWLLLSPVLVLSLQVPAPAPAVSAKTAGAPPNNPGCPSSSICGNVTIPYPFGLSDACSWDESFTISCYDSFSPPRPYYGLIEVISISVETGEMRVFSAVSRICFNSSTTVSDENRWWFDFSDSPFLVTPGRNEFTGIGCHTLALLRGKEDRSYFSGCVTTSTCPSLDEAASCRQRRWLHGALMLPDPHPQRPQQDPSCMAVEQQQSMELQPLQLRLGGRERMVQIQPERPE